MSLDHAMTEAMRLTRTGDLGAATRLIQTALAGGAFTPPPPVPASEALLDLRPAAAKPAGGGVTEERTWRGPAGTIGYRIHTPPDMRPGLPIVVMLHGCTQSPEDFARGTGMDLLADADGFVTVYPRQTASANAQKCWNWFDRRHQLRDGGEPSLIAGAVRQVLGQTRGDPARVYVAGLSAGGAAAAIMAEQYPDLFAAVGIHSGIPCGSATDLTSALTAMRRGGRDGGTTRFVPTITVHGDRDTTVSAVNSRQIAAATVAACPVPLSERTEQGTSPTGRRYTRIVSSDAAGRPMVEEWTIAGAGHAWAGGDAGGSYTDPAGPDASRAMLAFFAAHTLGEAVRPG